MVSKKSIYRQLAGSLACLALLLMNACGSLVSEMDRIRKKFSGDNAACTVTAGAVTPLYAAAPNWLDYLANDGASPLRASGASCLGSEGGHYGSCIHAGEMRSVALSCVTDCAGVTASDALGAFQWKCLAENGAVRVVSTGLRLDKNLSDLVDFPNGAWRQNFLIVQTGGAVATSAAGVWWNNPIVKDTAPGSLASAGTVYLFDSNPNGNFTIAADRIAFVGKPGVLMRGVGDFVTANSQRFLWIEGDFKVFVDGDRVLKLDSVKFSMFRHLQIQGTGGGAPTYATGVQLRNNTTANFFLGMNANGLGDLVIDALDSPANTFHRFLRTNGWHGIGHFANGGNRDTVMIDFVTASTTYQGIYYAPSNEGSYSQNGLTLFSNSSHGLELNSAVTLLSHVSAGHTSAFGAVKFEYGSGSTIADLATVHNAASGVEFATADTYNYQTGLFLIGNNGTDCTVAANSGLTAACGAELASDFVLHSGISLATSFVGRVFQNDALNGSTATAGLSAGVPSDWLNFSNRYRAWGWDGGDMGSAGNSGHCTSGCRLWDYSLRSSDSILRARLSVPAATDFLFHRWGASTSAECQVIKGAVWQDQVCNRPGYMTSIACTTAGGSWSTGLCTTKFLRHAHELFFDGVGNDNGLCESGEACLYTPNIGAYQGHGKLIYIGAVTGGAISDVDLYRYETNGI